MKILGLLLCLLAYEVVAESPCGDWEPFKDEKCFKIFDKAGLQTFDEAEKTCHQQDLTASLIVVKSQTEQDFLTNFIFTKGKVVDNVWIGAKYLVNKFQWEDKSNLSFTNWSPNRPKHGVDYCIQMHSDDGSVGKWDDEPCKKKNLVVCQKSQTWSIARLQQTVLDIRKAHQNELNELNEHLKSAKNEIVQLNSKLVKQLQDSASELSKNLTSSKSQFQTSLDGISSSLKSEIQGLNTKLANSDSQIASLKKNPVPVGFVYVQLPNEKSPQEVWPGLVWSDVSSAYSGVFFRVEGGDAAAFGTVQKDNAPRVVKVEMSNGNDNANLVTPNIRSLVKGSNSDWVYTGDDAKDFRNTRIMRLETSGGEVRPRNMAIRVWKRTA